MAGMFKVTPLQFALMDAAGSAIWSGAFLLTGWWFRDQLELVAAFLAQLGSGLTLPNPRVGAVLVRALPLGATREAREGGPMAL